MSWLSVVWAHADEAGAADVLARREAAHRCGVPPSALAVVRACPVCGGADHGRPSFVGPVGASLPSVSLGRSTGVVIVAVSSADRVGVDVEAVDRFRAGGVADVLLHESETAQGIDELAVTWVRKEAVLKAAGVGLGVDPSGVRLSPPHATPSLLEWPAEIDRSRPDWLLDIELVAGLRAAVAGSGPVPVMISVRRADPAVPPG